MEKPTTSPSSFSNLSSLSYICCGSGSWHVSLFVLDISDLSFNSCPLYSLTLTAVLRQKDAEQALILEEKMSLQLKLLAAAGVPNVPSPPSYTHLVAGPQESSTTWQHVMTTVKVRDCNVFIRMRYCAFLII